MATSSTVAQVRTQLVTVMGAALAPVPVSRRQPASAEVEREHVWLERSVTGRQSIEAMTGGRKHREETYTQRLVVSVLDQEQNEADVVEARAMVILATIENTLATDPKLGFAPKVIEWAMPGEFEVVSDLSAEPQGWLVEIRFSIEVYAHLT